MRSTVPTSLHVEPPLVEYCQVPLPLLNAVIAMPSAAPLSTSRDAIAASGCNDRRNRLSRVVYLIFRDVVSVMVTLLSRSGASLTASYVIEAIYWRC